MEIKFIVTSNEELIKKYNLYKAQLKKLYTSSTDDRKKLIANLSMLANNINEMISIDFKNTESKPEEFYTNNIKDVETENILMNGMFTREGIEDLLEQKKLFITEEFRTFIIKQIEGMKKEELLFIWNM